MSKEIKIDFDTIFWSSTYEENLYLYISNLKSRIYQLASQNNYSKMHKLQDRLILSRSAKIMALNVIKEKMKANNEVVFLDLEQKFFIQNNNLYENHCENLDSLCNKIRQIELKFIQNLIIDLLIIEAVKPYFNAVKDKNSGYTEIKDSKYIFNLINDVVAEKMLKKNYLSNFNLNSLLSKIDREYILTRMSNSILISKLVKRRLNSQLLAKFTKSLVKYNFFKSVNSDLSLFVFIYSFLCYLVYLETSYLLPLSLLNKYSPELGKQYYIINYQNNIFLYGKSKQAVNFLLRCFKKTMLQYINFQANNKFEMSSISSVQCHFYDYFLLKVNGSKVSIAPSKDSQRLLLYQVNIICSKFKGDSFLNLAKSLNVIFEKWIIYFGKTNKRRIFALLDYLIYLKIRPLISKRKAKFFDLQEKYPSLSLRLLHLKLYSLHHIDYY